MSLTWYTAKGRRRYIVNGYNLSQNRGWKRIHRHLGILEGSWTDYLSVRGPYFSSEYHRLEPSRTFQVHSDRPSPQNLLVYSSDVRIRSRLEKKKK